MLLTLLSHAASLDGDALANDAACGAPLAGLGSLALHVAAVRAADRVILGDGNTFAAARTMSQLVQGGCHLGIDTKSRRNADEAPVLQTMRIDGVRARDLLKATTAPDIVDLLVADTRPLSAVSPLHRFLCRVLATILVDGSTGGCPVDTAAQDACTAEVLAIVHDAVSAASTGKGRNRKSHPGGHEPLADVARGIADVIALLTAPLQQMLREVAMYCPRSQGSDAVHPDGDDASPAALLAKIAAISRVAPMDTSRRDRASAAASPISGAASRPSELQVSMLLWTERVRTAILTDLIKRDWIADAVAADAGKPAALHLLMTAAGSIGDPHSAAAGEQPIRRFAALLEVAREPLAVLAADHKTAAPPPRDAARSSTTERSQHAKGDNLLHALLRPVATATNAVIAAAESRDAPVAHAKETTAAFEATARNALFALNMLLGRLHDTKVSEASMPGEPSAGHDDDASVVLVGTALMAPTTTQRWLDVGDGPEARRRVAVACVGSDGLTPYLVADKARRIAHGSERVSPAVDAALGAICDALSVSEFDVV